MNRDSEINSDMYSADLNGNEDSLYVLICNNVQDVLSGKKYELCRTVCVCVAKRKLLKIVRVWDEWEE